MVPSQGSLGFGFSLTKASGQVMRQQGNNGRLTSRRRPRRSTSSTSKTGDAKSHQDWTSRGNRGIRTNFSGRTLRTLREGDELLDRSALRGIIALKIALEISLRHEYLAANERTMRT